jgi:hypothetical protein
VDTTVSPRIRLFALVGGLAAAALAGGMLFLARASTDAGADLPLPPPAAVKHTPAATTSAKSKPNPKPKRKPRHSVVAANGLPMVIATKLARHDIVVAALYSRGAPLDRLARDEARAGAKDAHAGFAAVDVSNKRVALALADKTKVLTAPAVLVFRRNGEVATRLDGFADRALVAELAGSAR